MAGAAFRTTVLILGVTRLVSFIALTTAAAADQPPAADQPSSDESRVLAKRVAQHGEVRWYGHRDDLPASALKVQVTLATAASRTPDGVRLPVRITNQSPHPISLILSYERDPGLLRLTDVYVSSSWQEDKPFWPAYLVAARPAGQPSQVMLSTGESRQIELRMDGTGSFGRDSFMETGIPGKYHVRVLVVFMADNQLQYAVSDQREVDLPNTPITDIPVADQDPQLPAGNVEITNTLRNDIASLEDLRKGPQTDLDRVERAGEQLLTKYDQPVELGQLQFQLAHVHGQSGLQRPDQLIGHVKKALEYPLPLLQRLTLYTYWGDAAGIRSRPLSKADRAEAATAYVLGLKQLAACEIPATIPHLPDAPPIPNGIPVDEEGIQKLRDYQRIRARADLIRSLIVQKDIFLRQLKDLYDPTRFHCDDRDTELREFERIAREQLGDNGEPLMRIIDAARR